MIKSDPVHRHRLRVGIALVCIVVACTTAYAMWPRERRLLERSRRITPVLAYQFDYSWLSQHELLIYTEDFKRRYQRHLIRIDTDTDVQTELYALEGLVNGSFIRHGEMRASPTGQWMLWTNEHKGTCAARLDGTGMTQWAGWWMWQNDFWLADGKHWMALDRGGGYVTHPLRAIIYNVERPQEHLILPVPASAASLCDTDARFPFLTIGNHALTDNAWDFTNLQHPASTLQIDEYTLLPGVSRLRHLSVRPPPNSEFVERGYSPTGNRIAWATKSQYLNPAITLLHRFIPAIKATPSDVLSLWVSDIDGRNMREIGHVAISEDEYDGRPELHWLPDGKRLSFIYKETLWTVPVD